MFLVSLELETGMEVFEAAMAMQGWWGSWRQSWPGMVGPRRGSLSVELEGAVKSSSTVLPMRLAARSRTGWGRWSEGAWGGPGLAQPMRVKAALRAR
jgi:hypothetical protein